MCPFALKLIAATCFTLSYFYVCFCEEEPKVEGTKDKINRYVGIFSNYIGSNMWAWVGVVAGAAFVLCLILWAICSLICCICGSRNK